MTWELTPELEDEIITGLENGMGLRKWCEGKGRPSRSTVLRWQRENKDFAAKCAHAREAAGELAAEEHYEVAQNCLNGTVAPDIAGRVLSAMQWRASKLASRVYGERQTISGDPDAPLATFTTILQDLDGRSSGLPEIKG